MKVEIEQTWQDQAACSVNGRASTDIEIRPYGTNASALDGDIDRLFPITNASVANDQAHFDCGLRYSLAVISKAFQDMQTAGAIDEIDQPTIIVAYVIALHAPRILRYVRHKRGDFTRRVRIGYIDDA